MVLTKGKIVEKVRAELVISKKESAALVESFFDIVKDELGKGNPVNISGFGKWTVKQKNARKGRNPQTGKALTIKARKVVTFQQSAVLRDEMNH
jgi:integration host factor subunit alpha